MSEKSICEAIMPKTCEDFPCCDHEFGDCDGSKYGRDEDLISYYTLHAECEHEAGYCKVAEREQDEEEYDEALL